MRYLTKLFAFILVVSALTAASASAQDGAKVTKIIGLGAATVTRAGAEIPVTEGMAIQVGDIVNTGPGASVYVQLYTGATATVGGEIPRDDRDD